jgi:hypothetical protein
MYTCIHVWTLPRLDVHGTSQGPKVFGEIAFHHCLTLTPFLDLMPPQSHAHAASMTVHLFKNILSIASLTPHTCELHLLLPRFALKPTACASLENRAAGVRGFRNLPGPSRLRAWPIHRSHFHVWHIWHLKLAGDTTAHVAITAYVRQVRDSAIIRRPVDRSGLITEEVVRDDSSRNASIQHHTAEFCGALHTDGGHGRPPEGKTVLRERLCRLPLDKDTINACARLTQGRGRRQASLHMEHSPPPRSAGHHDMNPAATSTEHQPSHLNTNDAVSGDDMARCCSLLTLQPDPVAISMVVIDQIGHEEALIRVNCDDARRRAVDVVLNTGELKNALGEDACLNSNEVAVVHFDSFYAAPLVVALQQNGCMHTVSCAKMTATERSIRHMQRFSLELTVLTRYVFGLVDHEFVQIKICCDILISWTGNCHSLSSLRTTTVQHSELAVPAVPILEFTTFAACFF